MVNKVPLLDLINPFSSKVFLSWKYLDREFLSPSEGFFGWTGAGLDSFVVFGP